MLHWIAVVAVSGLSLMVLLIIAILVWPKIIIYLAAIYGWILEKLGK